MIDVNLIGAPAFTVEVRGDDFIYTGINRRMDDLMGSPGKGMIGRSPAASLQSDVASIVLARYRRCVSTRGAIEAEIHHKLPGGDVWWHVTLTPVLDADGSVTSLVGVATDITDRKRAERQRREAEARMALAMDVLDGGFWHLDLASGEMEVTPKLAALMAGSAETRMSWAAFTAAIHADDLAIVDLAPLIRGTVEIGTAEYRVVGAGGETRWFRSRRRMLCDAAGAPHSVIGVMVDVTEQRQLREAYERQAGTDSLTGLANRRAFDACAVAFLKAAAGERRRFGLILLDLDRFKTINDEHGHAAGDVVLRALGSRLRGLVRPDDVVARLGGDEFAILVADVCDGALPRLAQRIVTAGRQPIDTPAGTFSVGLSVGLTTSVDGDAHIGDLANRADRALYDVKLSGRGAWREAA